MKIAKGMQFEMRHKGNVYQFYIKKRFLRPTEIHTYVIEKYGSEAVITDYAKTEVMYSSIIREKLRSRMCALKRYLPQKKHRKRSRSG